MLSIDEKPQIQAFEREASVLSLRPGAVEARSADYLRHGTSTLFAALEVGSGQVTERLTARHATVDFLAFLDELIATIERFTAIWNAGASLFRWIKTPDDILAKVLPNDKGQFETLH